MSSRPLRTKAKWRRGSEDPPPPQMPLLPPGRRAAQGPERHLRRMDEVRLRVHLSTSDGQDLEGIGMHYVENYKRSVRAIGG